jgi:hypothetical protein
LGSNMSLVGFATGASFDSTNLLDLGWLPSAKPFEPSGELLP